jgi:ubiquinone/menaquinone biosynthesis C-methylase UbiE
MTLGCGDGALTYMIWKQNPNSKITGTEPEPIGRNLAKEMFRKKHVPATFLESSTLVPDESHDIVICADVIEHVRDPDGLVAEISRVLKPNGRTVISTPVRLTEFPWDEEHVREFFPEEFRQLIEKYFTISNYELCSSIFATALYSWRPKVFLNRPIIGWLMSLLNICFGINLMRNLNALDHFWMTQTISGLKLKT